MLSARRHIYAQGRPLLRLRVTTVPMNRRAILNTIAEMEMKDFLKYQTTSDDGALDFIELTLGSRLRTTVTPAWDQPQIPKDAAD